jgi:hypothetical protein
MTDKPKRKHRKSGRPALSSEPTKRLSLSLPASLYNRLQAAGPGAIRAALARKFPTAGKPPGADQCPGEIQPTEAGE